ncbi:MAG TPA: TIM barrel protein [Chloroflexota bacterium]|nr:TIM barrel protein [Chloroflexota bacterium]
MPSLSVSTWSLHRALGRPAHYGPEDEGRSGSQPTSTAEMSLLELPARVAAFGIHRLEMCHFHLPRTDAAYLDELRAALSGAGVELWQFLVDAGDITDSGVAARDLRWIAGWIEVAAQLDARRVRVVAGKAAPSEEALERSLAGFRQLLPLAQGHGLRLTTENWYGLLGSPAQVRRVLDALQGEVGLCLDFGNWDGPSKYDALAEIAPYAESCHTKARFASHLEMDRDDYVRCLDLVKASGFSGPHTLIYDGPDADEWAGLRLEAEVVAPYL